MTGLVGQKEGGRDRVGRPEEGEGDRVDGEGGGGRGWGGWGRRRQGGWGKGTYGPPLLKKILIHQDRSLKFGMYTVHIKKNTMIHICVG